MHKFASFNHKILPANDIKINALSSASLYGKGVFTTIAIYNSKPFLWEKHWRRLNDNAQKLGIDISKFDEQKVYSSLEQIIKKNNASNARCRLTLFDQSSNQIWQRENISKISLLIQTADQREIKKDLLVNVSSFPVNSKSPLAGIKSCNYLENLLASEDAKTQNFDEAIRLNERGEIASACLANVFWIKGEKIFTPSLKTGCLAGTTREFVLEEQQVYEVIESLESIQNADSIFLTSTGIGLCLASINKNKSTDSSVFTELKKSLEKQYK